jgi:hypothetical protein
MNIRIASSWRRAPAIDYHLINGRARTILLPRFDTARRRGTLIRVRLGTIGRACRVVVAVAALALLFPVPAAGGSEQIWITTGTTVRTLHAVDPVTTARVFSQPSAYVTGNEDGTQNQVPAGWSAVPTLKYESYARFRADVLTGSISPAIRSVVYDPENWAATPLEEREDPYRWMRRFYELAKSRGYHVQQAPSRDLMQVPGAVCRKRTGETLSVAFLRCNVAGRAAPYADLLHIQAQVLERDPAVYHWFVNVNRERALAANPAVVITSNLSTSPYDYVATPLMLLDAWSSVTDVAQGHYFSMNREDVAIGAEFFRTLTAAGDGD